MVFISQSLRVSHSKHHASLDGRYTVFCAAQKYEKAAKVHGQMKALGNCMRQHFRAVHSHHIIVEIDGEIGETGKRSS